VNQKTYFVVSHCDSLWICQCGNRTTKASFVINWCEVKQGRSIRIYFPDTKPADYSKL